MSSRLPSPSMLIALAALVMATTGSAIAAKHYLITSTKQIKPSVLKKLKGKRGPQGLVGPQGAAGAAGVAGANGVKGTNGTNGTNGLGLTADQTLPSGATEVGAYSAAANASGDRRAVTFEMRPKLPAAIDGSHYGVVSPGGPTTASCPGSPSNPTAAPGYLCVYEQLMTSMSVSGVSSVEAVAGGAGVHGATMFMTATGVFGSA